MGVQDETITAPAGADEADLSVAQHERDLSLASRALLEEIIRKSRAALVKLDDGTYGRCDDCDEAIPAPRLSVYPEAPTCVPCQVVRESSAPFSGEPDRVPRLGVVRDNEVGD